jgi:hypothetical protein
MNEADVAIRFAFAIIIGMVLAVFWSLRKK